MKITLVVAVSRNGVIGKDNKMPWHLPADFKHFKDLTSGGVVLMGRKTYESIGRPLPNRINMVLSRDKNYKVEGIFTYTDIMDALFQFSSLDMPIYIIGGSQVYKQAMELGIVEEVIMTRVLEDFEGDATFELIGEWDLVNTLAYEANEKNKYSFDILTYKKRDEN